MRKRGTNNPTRFGIGNYRHGARVPTLEHLGHTVIGPSRIVEDALAIVEIENIDIALLAGRAAYRNLCTLSQEPDATQYLHVRLSRKWTDTLAREISMGRKKRSANWHEQAEAWKAEAEKLPHGREREELERKARQLDIACHFNEWASAPGLQPPK